jgi:hypothetical protein
MTFGLKQPFALWFFVTLLCFKAAFVTGQNYRTVNLNDTAYYSFQGEIFYSDRTVIEALHIDSTSFINGGQSLHNFIRFDITQFSSLMQPSRKCFIGDSLFRMNNGDDVFLNSAGDSILIRTNTPAGSSWTMYRYPGGDYLEATVTSVLQQPVLGVADSVKVITLQLKNSAGVPLPGFYNGKSLLLGKETGLILTYGFRNFPADTTVFELTGKETMTGGYQNLTEDEIFDFNIGDEFQYHGFFSPSAPSSTHTYLEYRVLNKTMSANGDTLIYQMDRFYHSIQSNFSTVTSYTMDDTIDVYHVLSNTAHLSSISGELFQVTGAVFNYDYGYNYAYSDTSYFDRSRKFSEDYYWYNSTNNYFEPPVGAFIFPQRVFAKGLGKVFELDAVGNYDKYDSLIYYKKGIEEWGQKLNWSQILGVESTQGPLSFISVYPNPSAGRFYVNYTLQPGTDVSFSLFNSIGSCIETFFMESGSYTIDAAKQVLHAGVYFYRIMSGNNLLSSGKVIVASTD